MRHGCGAIRLWDRRPDPRRTRMERGRSINLALAARGIRALEHAGVMEKVRPLLIPMRGRMIHDRSGATALQPYGQLYGKAANFQSIVYAGQGHLYTPAMWDRTLAWWDEHLKGKTH